MLSRTHFDAAEKQVCVQDLGTTSVYESTPSCEGRIVKDDERRSGCIHRHARVARSVVFETARRYRHRGACRETGEPGIVAFDYGLVLRIEIVGRDQRSRRTTVG